MKQNALIVFVKAPVSGKVKTRLVPPLTHDQAAELYRHFLQDSYKHYITLSDLADIHYFYSPDSDLEVLQNTLSANKNWHQQSGESLGDKMLSAFSDILTNYKRAVIVGSDHPSLPMTFIKKAFNVLKYVDVSIGPSLDGGYYCIGMNKANQHIFSDIEWSTSTVYQTTLGRIKNEKLDLFELPEWYDIDDIDSLKHFIANTKSSEHPLLYDYLKTISIPELDL